MTPYGLDMMITEGVERPRDKIGLCVDKPRELSFNEYGLYLISLHVRLSQIGTVHWEGKKPHLTLFSYYGIARLGRQ